MHSLHWENTMNLSNKLANFLGFFTVLVNLNYWARSAELTETGVIKNKSQLHGIELTDEYAYIS